MTCNAAAAALTVWAVLTAQAALAQNPQALFPPNVILPNNKSLRIGEVGGLEANAYTARASDPTSLWFNQAGIAGANASPSEPLLESGSQLVLDQIAGCVDSGKLNVEIDLREGRVPAAPGWTVEKKKAFGHLFRQICDTEGKASLVVDALSRRFVLRNVRIEPRCKGVVGWVVNVIGPLLTKTYTDVTLFQMPENLPFTIESVDSGADWLAIAGKIAWTSREAEDSSRTSP
jgi:hypothetical protein